MYKVNCHSVPKVIIGSLFSNKVMNIHGIPLTDSVHTVLCLDKRLKIRQINTNLYDCGVSWLVQHLLKLDPVSANQNKEQRTSDTVVCRTHEWISSPLASLCSVPTAFCDYDFSLGFFLNISFIQIQSMILSGKYQLLSPQDSRRVQQTQPRWPQ